jgi:two-component system, NtrC family, response regulator HydG
LEKTGQSRTRAAQLLGVSQVTLYKKMKKYCLFAKTSPSFPFEVVSPLGNESLSSQLLQVN